MISRRPGRTELQLAMAGTGFIASFWKNRQFPQGLKPAFSLLLNGAAEAAPLQRDISATATEAHAIRKLPHSSKGSLSGPPHATTPRQSNCGTGRGAPELTLEAR